MRPEISVVVPSYNRREPLRRLLDGLEHQDLAPERFEVIIVLDGSSDGSAEMLRERKTAFELRVFEQANAGAGAARNRGVAEARAPYCLFVDDDMVLDAGLLREHLAAQAAAGGAIVAGYIETIVTRRGFPEQTTRFWNMYQAARNSGRPVTYLDCFTGNMSVEAEAFRAAGGFDAALVRAEDVELAFRMTAAGVQTAYAPKARATQYYDKTTAQILRDHWRYGQASIQLLEKRTPTAQGMRFWSLAGSDPLYAEVARLAIRVPLPMWLCRALGRLPTFLPGVPLLFSVMRTHAMHRGARAALHDRERWDATTTGVRILRYRAERVTPEEMRAQLGWLRKRGVAVIPLSELAARLAAGRPSERFTVVITVDGEKGTVDPLAAALAAQGYPWAFFAAGGDADAGPRPACEVGVMAPTAAAAAECARGSGVLSVAYDDVSLSDEARLALAEAGCAAACSGRRGVVGLRTNPLALPRLEVPGGLSAKAFGRLVRLGRPATWLPF